MTNQPRRDDRPSRDAMSRGDRARDGTDQVLSRLSGRGQPGREEPRRMAQDGERDWSAALALLHRAGEAIRANAEQAEKMEAHARALWARASEEIERAQARINELEAHLQASEARAAAAEAQVAETREWARRIHAAIQAELAAGATLLRSRIGPAPSEAGPGQGAAESAGMNGVLAGVAEALDGFEAPPA